MNALPYSFGACSDMLKIVGMKCCRAMSLPEKKHRCLLLHFSGFFIRFRKKGKFRHWHDYCNVAAGGLQ
jgi:hypothetical protein